MEVICGCDLPIRGHMKLLPDCVPRAVSAPGFLTRSWEKRQKGWPLHIGFMIFMFEHSFGTTVAGGDHRPCEMRVRVSNIVATKRAPTSKPLRPQPWSPEDDGLMALDAWSHIMGLLDCELSPTWRLHHQKVTESPNSGRDHTHRSTQYMFVTLAPPGASKVQYSLNDSQAVGGLKRRDRMFRCVAQPPTTSSQLLWVEHCNMLMYPYDLPMSSRFAPWYPLKLPASLEIRTIWWRCMIM